MPKAAQPERLQFNVSSGLKSVLGSDLITDDEVAVFELVKNSFDAGAKRVDLFFSHEQIVISDNGSGMSFADIKEKWLFVAYSAKRGGDRGEDFRNDIADRAYYAGSKGIGRFSSDRLGKIVRLQTRPKGERSEPVHSIEVNWTLFDKNHRERFEKIDVKYSKTAGGFELPVGLPTPKHGTAITISKPRRSWSRSKILDLKSALAKLINPFGSAADNFRIFVHAPAEAAEDHEVQQDAERRKEDLPANAIVNGEVGNFIFATLQEKTTYLDVKVDAKGSHIESRLIDRGELIYHVREPNRYTHLAESGFSCQLFFLNTSAKQTFTRRMGVPAVQFGSVFLFRNGFRVFPIGEEGDDWFHMDRRKQQGFKRFLGTRDVIGRINVFGSDEDFSEASSRNAGLIYTPAVVELRRCFIDQCLKRLERYVVPVTFVDKEDKNVDDVSRLMTDPGRARVAAAVAKLVDGEDIELLDYSKRLIGLLSERSSQFEESLVALRAIAESTKDRALFGRIEDAEKRFAELRKAEKIAVRQANEERVAKEAAQARAATAEQTASAATEKYEEERKRSSFLTSIATLDTDTIVNLHHQVTIYAVDIQTQIENLLLSVAGKKNVPTSVVMDALESITLLNRKILGIAKFATKANFRLESEMITRDLGEYIQQYIESIARDFPQGTVKRLGVTNDGKKSEWTFKPIDVSVVLDNLISNARKVKASAMDFAIEHPTKDSLYLRVTDNGPGFSRKIEDGERMFEKGYTKTDGSGLGLYHVRQVLGEMNGTIEAITRPGEKNAGFLIKLSK
jgi:signal transduction histidine kinase